MAARVPPKDLSAPSRPPPQEGARASRSAVRLTLLSAFALRRDGHHVPLPMPAQRLLAFLALQAYPVQRSYAAGILWLESTEERASGSLRSALWRLGQVGDQLVRTTGGELWLAPRVDVDYLEAVAWARRVLSGATELDESEPAGLSGELLPGWYEDWVSFERERLRELRVRALETLCVRLTATGRYGSALEAGLEAVHSEPLRESAHRSLIELHLAEGNQAEALRRYSHYRQLLYDRLGLEPSARMEELVRSVMKR